MYNNQTYQGVFSDEDSNYSETTTERKPDNYKTKKRKRGVNFGESKLSALDPEKVFKVFNFVILKLGE
jgi:hypothetical protein